MNIDKKVIIIIMGLGGHGPTRTHSGQSKDWSGKVQDRIPYCGQL